MDIKTAYPRVNLNRLKRLKTVKKEPNKKILPLANRLIKKKKALEQISLKTKEKFEEKKIDTKLKDLEKSKDKVNNFAKDNKINIEQLEKEAKQKINNTLKEQVNKTIKNELKSKRSTTYEDLITKAESLGGRLAGDAIRDKLKADNINANSKVNSNYIKDSLQPEVKRVTGKKLDLKENRVISSKESLAERQQVSKEVVHKLKEIKERDIKEKSDGDVKEVKGKKENKQEDKQETKEQLKENIKGLRVEGKANRVVDKLIDVIKGHQNDREKAETKAEAKADVKEKVETNQSHKTEAKKEKQKVETNQSQEKVDPKPKEQNNTDVKQEKHKAEAKKEKLDAKGYGFNREGSDTSYGVGGIDPQGFNNQKDSSKKQGWKEEVEKEINGLQDNVHKEKTDKAHNKQSEHENKQEAVKHETVKQVIKDKTQENELENLFTNGENTKKQKDETANKTPDNSVNDVAKELEFNRSVNQTIIPHTYLTNKNEQEQSELRESSKHNASERRVDEDGHIAPISGILEGYRNERDRAQEEVIHREQLLNQEEVGGKKAGQDLKLQEQTKAQEDVENKERVVSQKVEDEVKEWIKEHTGEGKTWTERFAREHKTKENVKIDKTAFFDEDKQNYKPDQIQTVEKDEQNYKPDQIQNVKKEEQIDRINKTEFFDEGEQNYKPDQTQVFNKKGQNDIMDKMEFFDEDEQNYKLDQTQVFNKKEQIDRIDKTEFFDEDEQKQTINDSKISPSQATHQGRTM